MYKRGELNISFKLVKGFTQSRKVFAQSSQRFSCKDYKIFNGRIILNQKSSFKGEELDWIVCSKVLSIEREFKTKKTQNRNPEFLF